MIFINGSVSVDVRLCSRDTAFVCREQSCVNREETHNVGGFPSANGRTSFIEYPGCGATVCLTHLSQESQCGFRCDGNYICTQILSAYLIKLTCFPSRDLAKSSNKSKLLLVYKMHFNQLYIFIILTQL